MTFDQFVDEHPQPEPNTHATYYMEYITTQFVNAYNYGFHKFNVENNISLMENFERRNSVILDKIAELLDEYIQNLEFAQ